MDLTIVPVSDVRVDLVVGAEGRVGRRGDMRRRGGPRPEPLRPRTGRRREGPRGNGGSGGGGVEDTGGQRRHAEHRGKV